MNSIGMPAILCAQSAKNGMRMPSATEAAKNRNMPTCAAPGARMNVVKAEVKLLRNPITSLLQKPTRPARVAAGDRWGALVDVNAYGARIARNGGFSAKRSGRASGQSKRRQHRARHIKKQGHSQQADQHGQRQVEAFAGARYIGLDLDVLGGLHKADAGNED